MPERIEPAAYNPAASKHVLSWFQLVPTIEDWPKRRPSVDYAGLLRRVSAPLDGIGKAMIAVARENKQATHIGMVEFDIAMDGRDFEGMRACSAQHPEDIVCGHYWLYPASGTVGPLYSEGWGCVVFPKQLMLDHAAEWEAVDYTRDPKTGYARMDGPWWCWTHIKQPIMCEEAAPKHLHWLSGHRIDGHD